MQQDKTVNFEYSAYELICDTWKIAHRKLKEAESAEKEARELIIFMAGGVRMENGVKISEVTRAGGYDYKSACDIMLTEAQLEPYKKPDSKYMKVSLY